MTNRQKEDFMEHRGLEMDMCKNSRGFSLIEVLIALVILSIALLGMASLMASATKYNASGNRLTEATTLAQDKLETLRITPWTQIVNNADVVPGATGTSYARSWVVVPNGDDSLRTVTMTVAWNDGVAHSVSIVSSVAK